ncbi:hypothetical protein LSCM1_08080 [Leishmania martiniquensis]|uniref:GPR1/FUN34/yaaH family n=1 Tax=Leishmania martiniquensis TaxID=1580590 RepID=A0A836KUP8_9TRYP|nr:hypothetical protein LSCM1_08080 [Leishmania martiniquensis]
MPAPNSFKDTSPREPIRMSSGNDLRRFHEKYSVANVPPSSIGQKELANARKRMSSARERSLKLKRQRLRELQEWEYQQATAPRKSANPGPLGLLGFGLSTVLLNLHNTGSFPLSTVIVAMGICLGGGAQFIAGLLEWVRGNTFAYVAFTAYGAFWLSLVCIWLLPNTAAGSSLIVMAASEYFVGVYLVLWGIFSLFMFMCTFRMNVAIFLVFLTVTLLFLMLGGANMANNTTALHAAGYEGIICGSLALYLAFAEVLNEVWDRTILPVVPMTQVLEWFGSSEKPAEAVELKNSVQLSKDNKSD